MPAEKLPKTESLPRAGYSKPDVCYIRYVQAESIAEVVISGDLPEDNDAVIIW